ncbi:tRNA threonylcarbamoyladenosine dehydratase [Spirochaetia bacterium]|nr:tRNA threonylcarbamoyladenosine dehydratase [Spirochaetia bacterium]
MTETPGTRPAFHRLGLLTGSKALAVLEQTRVLIFGLGGVGSWTAEALVRSGIGYITIVDNDTVCVTNINRQIQAVPATVGLPKAAALMQRLLLINPGCQVTAFNQVFSRETAEIFEIEKAHYVIDAIDSLTHKLDLIETVVHPVLFSSMGMAAKLDPTRLKTADIWDTVGCPLARLVRQGLRKRGFTGHFTAVYSDEQAIRAVNAETFCGGAKCLCTNKDTEWCSSKKVINGSAVPVTAAAGMILASLVLQDVLYKQDSSLEDSRDAFRTSKRPSGE